MTERNGVFLLAGGDGGEHGDLESARRHRRKKKSTNCIFAPGDSARNVLRERSSQLSGSRAPGPIYALTTPGTCNYPRQFYDSADLGTTRGREKAAVRGRSGRGGRAFDLMTSAT